MIEFWLSLIVAALLGNVSFPAAASSMTSEDLVPAISFAIEWPCALFWGDDIEYCYIIYTDGVWETGP